MTTEYSIQKMVSDGTLSTIALGIQYLQRNDIYIRIAGEETPQSGAPSGYTWSFLDNTTLKILPVVPNGVEVVAYRRTDVDAMYNIYSQNAQFDEATIDENNQQLLYTAQEYLEQGIPGAGVDIIEFIRDDGSFTYYRIKRTDGSYSDEFYVPSASSSTKVLTREALRRTYAEAGLNLVEGSFEAGGTLTSVSDVLLHEVSGKAYSWGGPFPKVVAAGAGVAGFVDRSSQLGCVVDSVQSLKKLDLAEGSTVFWSSYYAGGSSGANSGIVVSGSYTEDDGSVFLLDNGNYVIANKNYPLSACQFGAVGDGVTDDFYRLLAQKNWALNSNHRVINLDAGKRFAVSRSPWVFNTSKTLHVRGGGLNSTDVVMLEGSPFSLFSNVTSGVEEQAITLSDFKIVAPTLSGYDLFKFRGVSNGVSIRNIRVAGGGTLFDFSQFYRAEVVNVFAEGGLLGLNLSDEISPADIVFMVKFMSVTWRGFRNISNIDFAAFTNTACIEFDTCNFEASTELACKHKGANVAFRNCYIENNGNTQTDALFIDQTDSVSTFDSQCLFHYADAVQGSDKCILKTDRAASLFFGQGMQWKLNKSNLGAIIRGPSACAIFQKQGRQGSYGFTTNYGDTVSASSFSEYPLRDFQFSRHNTQASMGIKQGIAQATRTDFFKIDFGGVAAQGVYSFKITGTLMAAAAAVKLSCDFLVSVGVSSVSDVRATPQAEQMLLGRNEGASKPYIVTTTSGRALTIGVENSTTVFDNFVYDVSEITALRGEHVKSLTKL